MAQPAWSRDTCTSFGCRVWARQSGADPGCVQHANIWGSLSLPRPWRAMEPVFPFAHDCSNTHLGRNKSKS